MVTTLLEKIESHLSGIKLPCEITLKITVLNTASRPQNSDSKILFTPETLARLNQEVEDSRRVVLDYMRLERIQFDYQPLPENNENLHELDIELSGSDGVLILADDSLESIMRTETTLTYLLEKVRSSTQIAVCVEPTTAIKGMEFLDWLSRLNAITQSETQSRSVQFFGLTQNVVIEVIDWLGDLLDGQAVLQGCTIQKIYVYDESGILVAYFAENDAEGEELTDPVLITAVYRAMETLFFEQQGITLKQLSLGSSGYEELYLAAVRHLNLGALFLCVGKVNQTLIWQIGTKLMQAVAQQQQEHKRSDNLSEVHYIEGKALFERLKPHLLGACLKCRGLLANNPSEPKELTVAE
ncbi:MAG: hypothetical protein ACXAEL_00815 [Candidatus Hodarchaeales archaeon]